MIAVPTLETGAADEDGVELARTLTAAGHRAVVVSRGGRLEGDVAACGAQFVRLDMASINPVVIARNAFVLARLIRQRHCGVVHALARAPGWSGYAAARMTGVAFLTTWYGGFRDQNLFKHAYNGVMARGEQVIAMSDQIADIIAERHRVAADRIIVIPSHIDIARFDPTRIEPERVEAVRAAWGVGPGTRVIMVVGRILRRKGHHVVVKAAKRLKEMGLKDFLVVFVGEDRGHTHYTGELWDLVLSTATMDVIRMAAPVADMPAAYACASVVVSAAVQPEGLQRAIVEAQAMARPVIVSDLAAGPEVVLTPPAVPESRITGLRFNAGDDAALAAALLRLFSMPEPVRATIGARGRDWVLGHFDAETVAGQTLALYGQVTGRRDNAPALVPQARQN